MKLSIASTILFAAAPLAAVNAFVPSTNAYSTRLPAKTLNHHHSSNRRRRSASKRASLTMISDGSDRSERKSLDISKTTYSALVKSPRVRFLL